MVTITPPTFTKPFQGDIHLHRSSAILQITTKSKANLTKIQANPIQESVNRVKWAARRKRIEKRSERDGEAYGKSDMSMI